MGHHRAISWTWPALQIHQVLADCGHVCFLLHDSCYDSRPAPCHLLPVAGLPWGSSVPLEHPCHGGMGLGTGPQPATGKGRVNTYTTLDKHSQPRAGKHADSEERKWELKHRHLQLSVFLVRWGHCGSAIRRGKWQSRLRVPWLPPFAPVWQVFIFSRSEVAPGEYDCWGHFAEPWGLKAYVTWMTVAVFLLPALIITICQVILALLAALSLRGSRGAAACAVAGNIIQQRRAWHEWNSVMFSWRLYLADIVWYPAEDCGWCYIASHGA